MRKPPGLMRRGARYWLRVAVPKDLRPIVGKREHWQSLGTSDFRQAVESCRLARVTVDATLAEARARLRKEPAVHTMEQIRHLIRSWFYVQNRKAARIFRDVDDVDRQEVLQTLGEDEAHIHRHGIEDSGVQVIAERFMADHRIHLERGGKDWIEVVQLVARADLEFVRRQRARHQHVLEERPGDEMFSGLTAAGPAPLAPAAAITLGTLIARYQRAPERVDLADKTKLGYAIVFRALKELLGEDRPVREISREDCREVQRVLISLPPNATKRFPGLPLKEVSARAERTGIAGLSPSAVNSYLTNLSSLFNWAVREEVIDRNPARGLHVPEPTRPADAVKPFSTTQLQSIFNAPLYTGCQNDEGGYATPGPHVVRRGRFWVPLLSLWTGMRLGECCQLHIADVVDQEGVSIILIQEGESGLDAADRKRIKTSAGRRFVPIHPELIRIGFLEYVSKMRGDGGRRLFPELKSGSDGYLSGPFSKWFNDPRRFLGKLDLTGLNVSFHSFRHSYRDALREADISIERVRALGGWAGSGSGTEERYGSGLTPRTLALEISKIRYPGLDLTHLHGQFSY